MDLGIRGKRALVCAASKGLGRACALAWGRGGVSVTIVARGKEALAATLAKLRAIGADCAFLCSAQAGYITGLNCLLDGGAHPGTF